MESAWKIYNFNFGFKKYIGNIFEIAWSFYIININLLINTENTTISYTYYAYNYRIIDYTPNIIYDCRERMHNSDFPNKLPNNYDGRVIKLMAVKMIPYALNFSTTRNEDVRSAGLEVTIMHTICKKIKFKRFFILNIVIFLGDINCQMEVIHLCWVS